MPLDVRRTLVDRELATKPGDQGGLSISKQCAVLEIHRAGSITPHDQSLTRTCRLMRLMDLLHLEDPAKGTRMLAKDLADHGFAVGRARVRRLMRLMRNKAVYCMPRTTVIDAAKYKHPYLLRDLKIERRNQVWAVDITCLPVKGGFMYMVAVIDVHTRYLLNWSISNTMEAEWVTGMISEAIAMHGKPEIINSDQGCQFTSEAYTALFRKGGVAEGVLISMDGKGRCDRQRLHRTLLAHAQARSPVPGSAHGWYRTLPRAAPASSNATTTSASTPRSATAHQQHATAWQPEISTEQRVMSLPWTPHFDTNNHTYI